MPDLSADRPLLHPEVPFTKDDVEAAVQRLVDNAWEGDDGAGDREDLTEIARIVLTSMWARRRLLPPSAEHREELRTRWQVQYLDKAFTERHAYFFDDRAEADECLATVHPSTRYSDIKLLSKISTSWVEVDRSVPE